MSAFQVSVTPTRLKNSRQKNEAREPTKVVLAPFSAKATVLFEEIPVSKIARRFLNVCNPSDEEIQVTITKQFPPDLNVQLQWTTKTITSQNCASLEIVWSPLSEIKCKETLQFMDNRNFRKEVSVIMKSVRQKANAKRRFPTLSSSLGTTSSRVLKLKSPSPTYLQRTVHNSRGHFKTSANSPQKRVSATTAVSPLCVNNFDDYERKHLEFKLKNGKENRNPISPQKGRSANFEYVGYTPAAITANTEEHQQTTTPAGSFDFMLSLPTPGSDIEKYKPYSEISLNPRKLLISASPDHRDEDRDDLRDEKIERNQSVLNNGELIDVPRQIVQRQTRGINKTFVKQPDIFTDVVSAASSEESLVEIDIEQQVPFNLNRTTTLKVASRTLSVIDEDEERSNNYCRQPVMRVQHTFSLSAAKRNIDKNLRDIKMIARPLHRQCESMTDLSEHTSRQKCTQGSMPNLNEIDSIDSIEQNRYYQQQFQNDLDSSLISNTSFTSNGDFCFNQNEILAQSSRYNIHETVPRLKSKTPKSEKQRHTSVSHTLQKTPDASHQKRRREVSGDSPFGGMFLKPPEREVFYMTVSPPKRSKLDIISSCSTTPKNACATLVKKWTFVKPECTKLQKTLALQRRPITPRKQKPHNRTILYDPDIFLQQYVNPDPFAATTTCDPFLASTIYLDERAIDKHEKHFKKWLNALVTPPEEFNPDCNRKIDVGRIFNEVKNKDLILAPTKEEISMNYLTKSRMDALRSAAVRLYMSEQMRIPCSKVAAYINKKAIKIRHDRNLHLDVVLQRYILELLLCFNPLWLRIGLEVVFGEIIYLHSNSDVAGLSTFILNRLFRDTFLEQKYNRAYALSDAYAERIKIFTLQKFLLLLLFLDKAKNMKIIAHNPCLFVRTSQYKETREIMLRFASELLANIGDVTRSLRRFGYELTHKQTFLDEFNYAFQNLSVDLRDGVRMTRIMEIILLREDLSKQLRVPAISRLQRIFNVNLALKALAEAEFVLNGDITAADIVDGHREKTLSLLWQIIYKFRAPKFNAAASVIQQFWRKNWLKVVITRRIKHKKELKIIAATTVLQSHWRGFAQRRQTALYKAERIQATVCVQKFVRTFLAKRYYKKIVKAIIFIQRWFRNAIVVRKERNEFLLRRESAAKLQKWYRRIRLANGLKNAAAAIREIQNEAKIRYENSIIIQHSIKSFYLHRKWHSIVGSIITVNRKNLLELKSAVIIQSHLRMFIERRKYQEKKQAAIKIQQHFKAFIFMRKSRAEFLIKRSACIIIQKNYRAFQLMRKEQAEYQSLKFHVVRIQSTFRMKIERRKFIEKRNAVLKLQQAFKGTLAMRKCRQEYLHLKALTIAVQQRFRANKQMIIQRSEYLHIKASNLIIQSHLRAQILMKKDRLSYLTLRTATVKIQRKWRATLLYRKIRVEYITLQYHATLIQRRFRGNHLSKIERCRFLKLKSASRTIQTYFRAKKLMQKERENFLKLKKTSIVLQNIFRAKKLMEFHRSQFLKIKNATTLLQAHWKATLMGKHQRSEFMRLKNATIKIQQWCRACSQRRIERAEFIKLRRSTIKIQQYFRATVLMKQERKAFMLIRQSTIIIQRRWIAAISMRRERILYLRLKGTVIKIQQKFRANLQMRMERTSYLNFKRNVIVVQQRFRANLEMRKTREHFSMFRSLVIQIQRNFRANILMRVDRAHYLRNRALIVFIQQKFRGKKIMLAEREQFHITRNTVLGLQTRIRGFLARKRFDAFMTPEMREHIRRNKAAKLIQRSWRGYRVRKRWQGQKILVIRQKIHELKLNVNPFNTLKHKLHASINFLKGVFCIQEALCVLIQLENMTRIVPHILTNDAKFVCSFCYGIMAQAIRSEADKQIIELCGRIILNLARYQSTKSDAFQVHGLVTIAQMLLRWCDKDCGIFNTLCTLVWIFSHCPEKKEIIRTFMTTHDAIYMLRETKKLVLRKENMRKNIRKQGGSGIASVSLPSALRRKSLPSLEPDFGVVRNTTYAFVCSVFAFETVLANLSIHIV